MEGKRARKAVETLTVADHREGKEVRAVWVGEGRFACVICRFPARWGGAGAVYVGKGGFVCLVSVASLRRRGGRFLVHLSFVAFAALRCFFTRIHLVDMRVSVYLDRW